MEWLHGVEERRRAARRSGDREREWIAGQIREAIEGEQRHDWRPIGAETSDLVRCAKCAKIEIRQIAHQLIVPCGIANVVEGLRRALQIITGSRE